MEGGARAGDEERADVERRARIGWRASLPAFAVVFGTVAALLEGAFVVERFAHLFT